MKANLFFLPQRGNDLHMTLFKKFECEGIQHFLPDNPNRKTLTFHTNGKYIIGRTNTPLDSIPLPMTVEVLDVVNGSKITGNVTLSRDRKIMTSPEERAEFISKHNRLPKSGENHRNIRMTDEQVLEYTPRLFEKAGLNIEVFNIVDSPLNYQAMSKRKKNFKTMDISFTATVTDIAAFESAWLNGIGQFKTYGFGMIRAVTV